MILLIFPSTCLTACRWTRCRGAGVEKRAGRPRSGGGNGKIRKPRLPHPDHCRTTARPLPDHCRTTTGPLPDHCRTAGVPPAPMLRSLLARAHPAGPLPDRGRPARPNGPVLARPGTSCPRTIRAAASRRAVPSERYENCGLNERGTHPRSFLKSGLQCCKEYHFTCFHRRSANEKAPPFCGGPVSCNRDKTFRCVTIDLPGTKCPR